MRPLTLRSRHGRVRESATRMQRDAQRGYRAVAGELLVTLVDSRGRRADAFVETLRRRFTGPPTPDLLQLVMAAPTSIAAVQAVDVKPDSRLVSRLRSSFAELAATPDVAVAIEVFERTTLADADVRASMAQLNGALGLTEERRQWRPFERPAARAAIEFWRGRGPHALATDVRHEHAASLARRYVDGLLGLANHQADTALRSAAAGASAPLRVLVDAITRQGARSGEGAAAVEALHFTDEESVNRRLVVTLRSFALDVGDRRLLNEVKALVRAHNQRTPDEHHRIRGLHLPRALPTVALRADAVDPNRTFAARMNDVVEGLDIVAPQRLIEVEVDPPLVVRYPVGEGLDEVISTADDTAVAVVPWKQATSDGDPGDSPRPRASLSSLC